VTTATLAVFERRGRHLAPGVVTRSQHLAMWVAHDLGRAAQIERVMARQCALRLTLRRPGPARARAWPAGAANSVQNEFGFHSHGPAAAPTNRRQPAPPDGYVPRTGV
jgi:hypothetical protein